VLLTHIALGTQLKENETRHKEMKFDELEINLLYSQKGGQYGLGEPHSKSSNWSEYDNIPLMG
jgi:hypothetical protein